MDFHLSGMNRDNSNMKYSEPFVCYSNAKEFRGNICPGIQLDEIIMMMTLKYIMFRIPFHLSEMKMILIEAY